MARKRKSRCKDRTPLQIKPVEGVADAGQTVKTRNRRKEAVSRKRKAVSETPRRRRSKRYKKVPSSSSVELIGVLPCCPSVQEREKYAKLGLDSGLFYAKSKPAKRKQSHISVITISSSDDEDFNNDKTAEWISKMDMETVNISSSEEPFPSGDAQVSQEDSTVEDILEAEKYRPQISSTQICSTPQSTLFKPLCASTPQDNLLIFQPLCLGTPETQADNLLIYKGPSFLENPEKYLRQNLSALQVTESSHTIASSKQNQGDKEYTVKSVVTSRSYSPKFYFGQSQDLQRSQQIYKNVDSTAPMWSDSSYFSSIQTSNNANAKEDFGSQETEAITYSLEQVPSTSHAPVSDPVLEVAPKQRKSRSRHSSPSK